MNNITQNRSSQINTGQELEGTNFDLADIDKNFVKGSFREGQREAIEFALNAYNSGKKIVIIEGPTGSGKTAIGMTIANFFSNSYYVTSSKQLQDQLESEFDDEISVLKGRNSYPCTFYDRNKVLLKNIIPLDELAAKLREPPSCDAGFCKTNAGRAFKISSSKCKRCFTPEFRGDLKNLSGGNNFSECPYFERAITTSQHPKAVMNFSSFLFQTNFSQMFGAPRDLVILDECHNTESQLLDFVGLTINDKHLKDHGLSLPLYNNAIDYVVWFNDNDVVNLLKLDYEEAKAAEDFKLEAELKSLILKLVKFIQDTERDVCEWVSQVTEVKNSISVTFKPVFVKKYVYPYIFSKGKRVLMMSATILNANIICENLGIDRSDVATYRMKNRFPVKNRPIYLKTVGKFTGGKAAMNEWAPRMLEAIEEIAGKYPGKRGIIHTHNFAIHDYIVEWCGKDLRKRLLSQKHFGSKQALMEEHERSDDTIIIAPAMHEGVDLKDDLSRFQVICKIPYANCFEDLQLKRRVELDRSFYIWSTALKLIQSYGRSIRSETDYADTFILDESIHKFMTDAKSMLPSWFIEAIVK